MPNYIFSILRFVPDPMRDESINIGFIVGSEEREEWHIEQLHNTRRARYIDDSGVLSGVLARINDLQRQIDHYEDALESMGQPSIDIGVEWVRSLHIDFRNLLQLSPPTPLVAPDLESAIDMLSDEFLVEPEVKSRATSKRKAMSLLRTAYQEIGFERDEHIIQRPQVRSGGYAGASDFIVANGEAVQLAQTWSFQVKDQASLANDIKAWAWIIRHLRDSSDGATAETEERNVRVPSDIDVELIYIPPENGDSSAYEEAHEAADEVEAKIVEVGSVSEVAERARHLA